MYKIDERVGCIAVVEESFNENCLYAEMDGVLAYWTGVQELGVGWKVMDWQREKAKRLCGLLNALSVVSE